MTEDLTRGSAIRQTLTRRNLLLGTLGGAGFAATAHGRLVGARQTSTGVMQGDCSRIEGLKLLLDWSASRVSLPSDELLPPLSWNLFSVSSIPMVFYYPGDWTAYGLWASGLTRTGAIAWQPSPTPDSDLVGARIVSPDGTALYETVSGRLIGYALDLFDGMSAAEQGFLGANQEIDPVCLWQDPAAVSPQWTHGGYYGDFTVVTGGDVAFVSNSYEATTALGYQSFVGPRSQFTRLMREVYIPIVYQLLSAGGSNAAPTPTPEF